MVFKIQPHNRLQEWVAEEKGYFRDEGLEYVFHTGDNVMRHYTSGSGVQSTEDVSGEVKQGAFEAMERALRHAAVHPEQIDYVHTHGTSTVIGDLTEVRALRRLFGGRPVPYSSTKGYIGHTISAAGAINFSDFF